MAVSSVASTLVPDKSCTLVEHWCQTHFKVDKLTYKWTIDNFSLCPEKQGQCIESPIFVSNIGSKISWCLQMYPKVYEQSSMYLSVYLRLVTCNKNVIRVKYKFALLDANSEETNVKVCDITQFAHGDTYGFKNFISKDSLAAQNGPIVNDKLTIFCEIHTVNDCVHTSGKKYDYQVNIPECRLPEDLAGLFETPKFSDLTLKVGDRSFKAHKNILSSRSPVFAAMFEHEMEEQKNNCVDITDIEPSVLQEMLRFIYTGDVENLDNMAGDLMVVADKYALERLKLMCEAALSKHITSENVIELLMLADLHNAQHLRSMALSFIKTGQATGLMGTRGWKLFIQTHPNILAQIFCSLAIDAE